MARPLRIAYENAFYHITARGHRKESIFYDDKDRNVFISKLDNTLKRYAIFCYAYCLMDNHYHLFLKTTSPNISQALHYLNASYANWFRTRYQLNGSIFQGRFKSILVDADSYALTLSAYIHLNPFRAGIINKLEDYSWSSYLDYLNLRKPQIDNLDLTLVLNLFSNDLDIAIKQYKKYIENNQLMEDPLKETFQGIALGNENFIQKIKSKIEEKSVLREIPFICSKPSYNAHEIIENICRIARLDKKELMSKKRGNIYRYLALYLIKDLTPLKLTQIGELFDMDYSAVSQAVRRFANNYKNDEEIKILTEKVSTALKIR